MKAKSKVTLLSLVLVFVLSFSCLLVRETGKAKAEDISVPPITENLTAPDWNQLFIQKAISDVPLGETVFTAEDDGLKGVFSDSGSATTIFRKPFAGDAAIEVNVELIPTADLWAQRVIFTNDSTGYWYSAMIQLEKGKNFYSIYNDPLDAGKIVYGYFEGGVEGPANTDNKFKIIFDPVAKNIVVNGGVPVDISESINKYPFTEGAYVSFMTWYGGTTPGEMKINSIGNYNFKKPYNDTVKPSLNVTKAPESVYAKDQPVTFVYQASDNFYPSCDMFVKVEQEGKEDFWRKDDKVSFDENGEYTVTLFAYDYAGNFTASESYDILVADDVIPPVIKSEVPDRLIPKYAFEGHTAVFPVVTAEDAVSGSADYTVKAYNGEDVEMTLTEVKDGDLVTGYSLTPTAADVSATVAKVVYQASDQIGNEGEKVYEFVIHAAADFNAKAVPAIALSGSWDTSSFLIRHEFGGPCVTVNNGDYGTETLSGWIEIVRAGTDTVVFRSEEMDAASFTDAVADARKFRIDDPGDYTLKYYFRDTDGKTGEFSQDFDVANHIDLGVDDLFQLRADASEKEKIERTVDGLKVTTSAHWTGGVKFSAQKVGQNTSVLYKVDRSTLNGTAGLDIQIEAKSGIKAVLYVSVKLAGTVTCHTQMGGEVAWKDISSKSYPYFEDDEEVLLYIDAENEKVFLNGVCVAEGENVAVLNLLKEREYSVSASVYYPNTGKGSVYFVKQLNGQNLTFDKDGRIDAKPSVLLNNQIPKAIVKNSDVDLSANAYDLFDRYPGYTVAVFDSAQREIDFTGGKFKPATAGNYRIKFTASTMDSRNGSVEYELIVLEAEPSAPTIRIEGSYAEKVIKGTEITLLECKVSDGTGIDPTFRIEVEDPRGFVVEVKDNKFVANRAGIYKIRYRAEGITGKTSDKLIRIEVTESEEAGNGNVGLYVGLGVGGAVLIAGVVVLVVFLNKRRKQH